MEPFGTPLQKWNVAWKVTAWDLSIKEDRNYSNSDPPMPNNINI